MASWGAEDATEPIYLCDEHAKKVPSSAPPPRVRSVGQYEAVEIAAEPAPIVALPKPSPAPPPARNAALDSPPRPAVPAQSPADRCAAIDRQILELALQIESLLSQSDATINVAGAIDGPLEQVILEIIGNPAMIDTQKDAAITRLGELQKSLKQSAGQGITLTLLEAHRIKQSLAGCLSGEIGLPEEVKAAYRAVHDSLEKAIHAALSQTANSLVSS